jgi:hypothetical protein
MDCVEGRTAERLGAATGKNYVQQVRDLRRSNLPAHLETKLYPREPSSEEKAPPSADSSGC